MNILLDFKVNAGREFTLNLTIGNESLHETSNDNVIAGVTFSHIKNN
jgi:hypothetical protein